MPEQHIARNMTVFGLRLTVEVVIAALRVEISHLLNDRAALGKDAKRQMLALALEAGRLAELKRRARDLLTLQASVPSTKVPMDGTEIARPSCERLTRAGYGAVARRIARRVAGSKVGLHRIRIPHPPR